MKLAVFSFHCLKSFHLSVVEMLIWTVMSAHEADCHHTIVNIIAVTTLHSVQQQF